jgi:hypothetical protein
MTGTALPERRSIADVQLMDVTPENRDSLPEELEGWVRAVLKKEARQPPQ